MDMGLRRAGNREHESTCTWCRKMLYITPETIRRSKRSVNRLNRRVYEKADILDQLDDIKYGLDPDGWEYPSGR